MIIKAIMTASILAMAIGLAGPVFGEAIIADHQASADFEIIPESYFDQIRSNYNFFYGHTSHGSQIMTGLDMLEVEDGVMYAQPTFSEYSDDLGGSGDTSWVPSTRSYLDTHPECNLVMWSWCGGCSDNTETGINIYLNALNQLEVDYPLVTFIYMTGHLDGSGVDGSLYTNNNQIRAYCAANDKILFDFADIESYDPDGTYYPDETDYCYWCYDWCAVHTCPSCGGCAHSHCFNCFQKGKAFWWMMARVAGWDPSADDYPYFPGDVNMAEGNWPPRVWGNDITYWTNGGQPCFLDGFWASADATGDCTVTGSDVTTLLNYLRGLTDIDYCPDYPPAWETYEELPETAPAGWPNCEGPISNANGADDHSPADSRDADITLWIGSSGGGPMAAAPGEILYLDVFMQTTGDVRVANMHIPLAIDNYYIDSLISTGIEGWIGNDLQDWDVAEFTEPYDIPGMPDFKGQSFMGWARIVSPDNPYLNYSTPTLILSFAVQTNGYFDIDINPVDCISIGEHPSTWPLFMGDSIGVSDEGYSIDVNISQVQFLYPYMPGDCNMLAGGWPPGINVLDVNYLVYYFRLNNVPCYMYNPNTPNPRDTLFYAAADANGDCKITGADIIYLVNYFKAIVPEPQYCLYYPPIWHLGEDFPQEAPNGWPYCREAPPVDYVEPFESSPDPEVTFWFGHPDSISIPATIGEVFPIDIYVQTSATVYGGDIHVPLGVSDIHVQSFEDSGNVYYPLTEWDVVHFLEPQGSPPNQPGWSGKSLIGWAEVTTRNPLIHSTIPIKAATFYAQAAYDPGLIGNTVSCLAVGGHPSYWTLDIGDTLGLGSLPAAVNILPVRFEGSTLEYLPGDVNMAGGTWPPSATGPDVTYLVGYFRGVPTSNGCKFDGDLGLFWASADANGDCNVIGSDVTKLVNVFRGNGSMRFCPSYPTAWPTQFDLPLIPPPDWPNCDNWSTEYEHEDIRGECNTALQDSGYMVLEVEGNDLHILHFNAYYNCCLDYNIDYDVDGFYILATEYLTGEPCYCMCYFDLESILFDLQPGEYTVCLINAEGDTVGVDTAVIGGN